MLWVARITHQCLCCFQRSLHSIHRRLPLKLNSFSSLSQAQVLHSLDEDCEDFLPWLERKAGIEISSVLSIGKSSYGRSLFASKVIKAGDCILKVPFDVQISSDNIFPEIQTLLGDEVGNMAKLATIILAERKMGQCSEWASYIRHLPQPGEIHSTIFWSLEELEMIRQSPVHKETINQRVQIKKEFLLIRPALQLLPEIFMGVTFEDFIHAYATVGSRAWGSSKGLSLIPFADFLNHNGYSESFVLNDEDKQFSEVVADRDYSPGEEVLIRYGKFPNATLLLGFGFTLPYNMYDRVEIHIDIPHHDVLRDMKLKLLQGNFIPSKRDVHGFNLSWDSFTIKEVRCTRGKGKGLPQSLRAFARVLCCTSAEELTDLAIEATQNDGRLARRPLRNSCREIQAHKFLLSRVHELIEGYYESIEVLKPINSPATHRIFDLRRKMALDLLMGELRILESASAWLKNYCASLVDTNCL